jgi:hypothetical protein
MRRRLRISQSTRGDVSDEAAMNDQPAKNPTTVLARLAEAGEAVA